MARPRPNRTAAIDADTAPRYVDMRTLKLIDRLNHNHFADSDNP